MQKAGTTKKYGTQIDKILKVAKKYGLKCEAKPMTIDEVEEYIKNHIPVILLLQAWTEKEKVNWEKDWADGHYVVAIGYDKEKIYFEDPASVKREYLSYKELEKRWHDVGPDGTKYINYGIAIYGKQPKFSSKKLEHMK